MLTPPWSGLLQQDGENAHAYTCGDSASSPEPSFEWVVACSTRHLCARVFHSTLEHTSEMSREVGRVTPSVFPSCRTCRMCRCGRRWATRQ